MGVAENEMKHSVVTEHIWGSIFVAFPSLPEPPPASPYIVLLSACSELHSFDSGLISVAAVKIKIKSKSVSQR